VTRWHENRKSNRAPGTESAAASPLTAAGLVGGRESIATLPRFLGIGAMKAGTTFLHHLCGQHPHLCMPVGRKEIHFFDQHYNRGVSWYASQFKNCGTRLPGEITPSYLYDPRAADRVARTLPEVRLIVCVRNPIDRAYSQFKQWVRDAAYGGSFSDFLRDHPNAVERGMYASQVTRYRAAFEADRIHFILFDDLVRDPLAEFGRLCDFLTVPRNVHLDISARYRHESALPVHSSLFALSKRLRSTCYRTDVTWPIRAARCVGIARLLSRRHQARRFPPLEAHVRTQLVDVYMDDTVDLSRMCGQDLVRRWGYESDKTQQGVGLPITAAE